MNHAQHPSLKSILLENFDVIANCRPENALTVVQELAPAVPSDIIRDAIIDIRMSTVQHMTSPLPKDFNLLTPILDELNDGPLSELKGAPFSLPEFAMIGLRGCVINAAMSNFWVAAIWSAQDDNENVHKILEIWNMLGDLIPTYVGAQGELHYISKRSANEEHIEAAFEIVLSHCASNVNFETLQ